MEKYLLTIITLFIFRIQLPWRSLDTWAVVVAQLVERLLPIPEVSGSKPVIGKIYIEHLFTFFLFETSHWQNLY